MEKCGECRFWEEIIPKTAQEITDKITEGKGVREGVCRKNPPRSTGGFMPSFNKITQEVVPQLIEITTWPVTKADKWCGEFKEIRELAEAIEEEKEKLKNIPEL